MASVMAGGFGFVNCLHVAGGPGNKGSDNGVKNMSKSLKRVIRALQEAGLPADVMEMDGSTRTAVEAADQAGCEIDQICKSVIFRGEDSGAALLFITAGGNQVDAAKASDLAGEPLGKADAALIRAQTGFAIGGVSPVGHLNPIRAWFDPRLSAFDKVYAAAGTPRHIVPVAPADLLRLTEAVMADFTA
jgi:prolyl-tRNA editing enzyme YbaK/EbsC (Cys-tRNA(Pro) deacylase)